MPSSTMVAIASGRTRLGLVPALNTSKWPPASWRSSPSAIWLRAEFPVHRMRTRFLTGMGTFRLDMFHDDFRGVFWKRWHEPTKQKRGCGRTRELCENEPRRIGEIGRAHV